MEEENYLDLDFDEASYEIKNAKVAEKDMYPLLIKDGFIFETEPVGRGAAYIMPDGKFLFLEENKDLLEGSKITHGSLDYYLHYNEYVSDSDASRILCQTDNAIRINDGYNFSFEVLIGLPEKQISYEQEDALEKWLDELAHRRINKVIVGDEISANVYKGYDLTETMPEDIIKKIRSYYRSGILREAADIKKDDIV